MPKNSKRLSFMTFLAAILGSTPAFATDAPTLNSGDTAWMLVSSALVLTMTIPGIGLFYGGMIRKKNVLATLAQSFGATALITPALIAGALADRMKFSAFL